MAYIQVKQSQLSSKTERALDAIPGFFVWFALVFCILCAFYAPRTLLTIVAILGVYTAVRFILAVIAHHIGTKKILDWEKIDWYSRYEQERTHESLAWDDVQHVVIIPNYKEPLHVLQRTLTALAQQYQAQLRITVVLAMEEGEAESAQKGEILQREFDGQFANFFYTVHPRGLPGELPGKSSNIAWAGKWMKRELVDRRGYNINHILITSTDADIMWHPNQFYALTYLFAINPERHNRMFQAVIRYHGNIWEIHPFMRLVNAYSTGLELAYLTASWWTRLPISSYSLSLNLLYANEFWDVDAMADDWHTFIKSFFVRKGNFKVEPVFLPFLADAATGETFWEAVKARYDQTLRHAWGSKEVGVVIGKMMTTYGMPAFRTLRVLTRIAHDILLAGAGWVILTVGSQLPLLLHPEIAPTSLEKLLQTPALVILGIVSTLILLISLILWYQDVQSRPPRNTPFTRTERILSILAFPLLPVLTVVFLALPVIQAQTRLMLGMGLEYRVTKKF